VKVLLYLLLPVLVVAVTAVGMWFRNRQPTSLESGVDAFRREMDALSPNAAPVQRRRPAPGPPSASVDRDRDRDLDRERPAPPAARPAPRRPGSGPAAGSGGGA
jgi:hypothetical protein